MLHGTGLPAQLAARGQRSPEWQTKLATEIAHKTIAYLPASALFVSGPVHVCNLDLELAVTQFAQIDPALVIISLPTRLGDFPSLELDGGTRETEI